MRRNSPQREPEVAAMKYGFDNSQWDAAKAEGTAILSEHAARRQMIPYSTFAGKLRAITLEAHDPRLAHLLGEISVDETQAGRGMLSALVVHKQGDMQPGPGFFEL